MTSVTSDEEYDDGGDEFVECKHCGATPIRAADLAAHIVAKHIRPDSLASEIRGDDPYGNSGP